MAEKKRRRQSKIFMELKQVELENLLEDEELVNHYRNKNYVAPVPRKWETLHEGARRGCSDEGELRLGKCLDRRYIEDYPFWKQSDKERIKRRKSMIQKQLKGKKRKKPKSLDAKDELTLQSLIKSAPDLEEVPYDSGELSETGAFLESVIQLLPRLYGLNTPAESRPRQEAERTIITPPEKLQSNPSQCHEERENVDKESNDETSATPREKLQSKLSRNQEEREGVGKESNDPSEMHTAPLLIPDVVVQSPSKRIESVEEMEVFGKLEDENLKKEFLAAFYSEDLLFCGSTSGKAKKKKGRLSVRQSVRRSARLIRDEAMSVAEEGSYFSVQEISVSRSKAARLQPIVDSRTEDSETCGEMSFQNVRKRKQVASIDNNSDIANDVINNRRRRRPGIQFFADESQVDDYNVDPLNAGVYEVPSSSIEAAASGLNSDRLRPDISDHSRLSVDAISPSASHSLSSRRRSSHEPNISLPDFVRRSLTGEFIPSRLVPEVGDLQQTDVSKDQSIESNNQTNSCILHEEKMLGKESKIDSSNTPSPNSRYLNQLNGCQTENRIKFNAENEEKEPVCKESTNDKENIKVARNVTAPSAKEELNRNYFSDSDEEEYISGIFRKKQLGPRILNNKKALNQAKLN